MRCPAAAATLIPDKRVSKHTGVGFELRPEGMFYLDDAVKFEIRISKFETNSNIKLPNVKNRMTFAAIRMAEVWNI
jgi:hypothetical protein